MALPNALLALLATIIATADTLNVTVPSEIEAGVETEIEIGFDYWKQPFVYETLPGPETTLYGTPTAPTEYSWYSLLTAKPTSTRQASAGKRRAKPPVAVPKKTSYAGLMVTTVLTCLVAFGIGSVLGWIWPDGLRHDG
ncbi:hypothetical protein BDP81DRAFT_333280 [Colletotrichum phormii]|uniref:Uncharacterized protein n=1 Tax=Colletotrichum phormii TaxID=359342 RepID=A0AAI9ZEC4_9PEZI|nr:uncharacterized protein BDP81DRAFT_333280 [Colletotrichum phormii]KAK1622901.1 hypothetical protein BDP81DRAFT_333280 [Colletotrichum phormii]